MTLRVAVLGSGRGSNLAALLRHCAAGTVEARVSLVVSDRPESGVLAKAEAAGVPAVVTLPRARGEAGEAYHARLLDVLRAEAPDLVVLAGFMRILPAAVVDAFPGRIVNIHPSLLPAFPGAHGVRDAHAAGVRVAGCTTHVVTADLDAGPILLQAALAVRPDDDAAALARRTLRLEHLLLPRTVQLFVEDRVRVEGGRATILPGPSWLHDPRVEPVSGALYAGGF